MDRRPYSARANQITAQPADLAVLAPETSDPPSSSPGSPVGIIAGAAVAGALVLGVAIASMVMVHRRRAAAQTHETHHPSVSSESASPKESVLFSPRSFVRSQILFKQRL